MADLHLGWEPAYLPDEKRIIRREERDQLLKKAVDYALAPKNNIQAVLIVGDLFENYSPPDYLVRQIKEQLSRLVTAGLLVVTVPGNHDEITYRESVYRRHSEEWPGELVKNALPELVVSQEINGMSIYIYSLAYTGGVTSIKSLDEYPRRETSGLHLGAFHGSLDWEGVNDRSLPLNSNHLAKAGYDYIALGHYHRYSEKSVGPGKAVYPGAVEFKSFNDPGTGYITVIEYTGSAFKIENITMEVRRHFFREVDISGFATEEELYTYCLQFADEEAMLHLNLIGTPLFAVRTEKLIDLLDSHFFYLEIENSAQFFAESFLDSIAQEPTVRGEYVRRMHHRQKEAATEQEQKLLKQALLKGLAALEGSDLK